MLQGSDRLRFRYSKRLELKELVRRCQMLAFVYRSSFVGSVYCGSAWIVMNFNIGDGCNIGVIGTGRIANSQLVPALNQVSGARFWSVLSRDKDRAESFAAQHGAKAQYNAFDSLASFLADPALDAVVIATPDGLHAQHAIASARAGKHVLLEKPMATSLEDAQEICDACARERVKLAIAYHMRWHDGHQKVANMLHNGELGTPHYARAVWTWKADDNHDWRAHEEHGRWWGLAGVGTHCVDFLRWMLLPVSGEVTGVTSLIDKSTYGGPHDETASLSLQFGDSVIADVMTSVKFSAPSRFELCCADATVIGEGTLATNGGGSIKINDEPLKFDVHNPYLGEIQNFVDAIAGSTRVAVSGAEGVRNIEILLQAD